MKSIQHRVARMQDAMNAIVYHDPRDSFANLIDPNREIFKGFKIIYSSGHVESQFAQTSLRDIEKKCSVLKKYFYGDGLLFFSDHHYDETYKRGGIKIPLDFSLSLDSNAAENFRKFEKKVSLDKDQDRFEELIRFLKGNSKDGFDFNFDYSFFIIENLIESLKVDNLRPFETVRALKRFNHLIYSADDFDVRNPQFNIEHEVAALQASQTLGAFHSDSNIHHFLFRRKVLYLVLLKAIELSFLRGISLFDKMNVLMHFVIENIGKFTKSEIYFAWKLLKYGDKFHFFGSVRQVTKKTVSSARGMSWDLFAIRYQETLSSRKKLSEFYVPFFASFDNRFVELAQACPVRCVMLNERDSLLNTVYLDEFEFQRDLTESLNPKDKLELADPQKKLDRINDVPNVGNINKLICSLEEVLTP